MKVLELWVFNECWMEKVILEKLFVKLLLIKLWWIGIGLKNFRVEWDKY